MVITDTEYSMDTWMEDFIFIFAVRLRNLRETFPNVCERETEREMRLPWNANTHIHNEEVQPAPVVGEVLLEAIGDPFEEHLQNKDVSEDLVSILQDDLHDLPLLNVDVLKRLQHTTTKPG